MERADRGARWMFVGGIVMAVAVLSGFLALAGVRLDERGPTPPEASIGEKARQSLSVKVARLRTAASSLRAAHPDVPQYATIAERAEVYSSTLGGVWQPWPNGAPSGRTNPPVETTAPRAVDGAGLVAMLNDVSASALSAAAKAPAEDRATYASVALGARLTAIDAAPVLGGQASCGTIDPVRAGSSAATAESVLVSDASRQWLQTDAARSDSTRRDGQLARIASVTELQSSMLQSGAPDKRSGPAAPPKLGGGDTLTNRALNALTGQLLVASSDAKSAEREAVVAYACSLYLTSEERALAGALPGSR